MAATSMTMDISTIAARASIAGAVAAILALAVLHLVRADLHPSRHMISEYAIGPNGWIMGVCFAAFAVASFALLISLLGVVQTPLEWAGLAALAAAVIGLGLGGAFPMDPTTATPENMSFSGRMHGMGFMIGVPGMILAVALLSIALRGQPGWNGPLLFTRAALVWISLVVMAWALMNFMKAPDGPTIMGWANRLSMVGFALDHRRRLAQGQITSSFLQLTSRKNGAPGMNMVGTQTIEKFSFIVPDLNLIAPFTTAAMRHKWPFKLSTRNPESRLANLSRNVAFEPLKAL